MLRERGEYTSSEGIPVLPGYEALAKELRGVLACVTFKESSVSQKVAIKRQKRHEAMWRACLKEANTYSVIPPMPPSPPLGRGKKHTPRLRSHKRYIKQPLKQAYRSTLIGDYWNCKT